MERDVLSIKVDQHAAVSKCGLEIEKNGAISALRRQEIQMSQLSSAVDSDE
jgi:hypothetical protein